MEYSFFFKQVLHFENVKDVPFGFQTVSSDVNKLSSFYSLKLIKRLYIDKSLNPSTVSVFSQLGCGPSQKGHLILQAHSLLGQLWFEA